MMVRQIEESKNDTGLTQAVPGCKAYGIASTEHQQMQSAAMPATFVAMYCQRHSHKSTQH
jgi:hypothetical protein